MAYRVIPVTPFEQNCTLFWCPETKEAAVIDPGGDLQKITAAIEEEGVTLTKILLTHGHIDHAGASATLAKAMKVTDYWPAASGSFLD